MLLNATEELVMVSARVNKSENVDGMHGRSVLDVSSTCPLFLRFSVLLLILPRRLASQVMLLQNRYLF